jgi:hypothetical protein
MKRLPPAGVTKKSGTVILNGVPTFSVGTQ